MKLSSIIYNMRQQPVITAVSVIGTALAIFLIMIVVMMQEMKVMSLAPEVNRDRTLHAMYIRIDFDNGDQSSGSMSLLAIKELFEGLDHVDHIGIYDWNEEAEASAIGKSPMMVVSKRANADYFDIIKYDFIDGAPYAAADVESMQKVAVIGESVARTLFGRTDVANREILINRFPYRIAGVIKDVNPITPIAYADIFIPIKTLAEEMEENEGEDLHYQYFGDYSALILAEDSKYTPQIKAQAASRYATLNNKLRQDGFQIVYFDAPYTQEESTEVKSSNNAPDLAGARRLRLGLYAILLLVPAINLSSVTQNRMRQRVSEIGLKRAFGCTKSRIMGEMFVENLLHTLVGAVIGLALSIVAAWLFADFLFVNRRMFDVINTEALFSPLSMLSWSTFAWAIFFCLLLNVLSCGIPSYLASRVNPATAVNGKY